MFVDCEARKEAKKERKKERTKAAAAAFSPSPSYPKKNAVMQPKGLS